MLSDIEKQNLTTEVEHIALKDVSPVTTSQLPKNTI